MQLQVTNKAKKQLRKLPREIQSKAQKSFKLLAEDYRHPSLRSRKMSGTDIFEARIDYHYRFSYSVEGDEIFVVAIGPHDEGLGIKDSGDSSYKADQ